MTDADPNNFCDFEVSATIENVFEQLIVCIEQHSGRKVSLNKPARDEELDELEGIIQLQLPDEYRRLYKLANGQKSGDEILPIFHDGFEFISLSDAAYHWNSLKDLWNSEPGFRTLEDYQGAVNGYWWSLKWIPFGYVCSGDLVCVDLDPTPIGSSAQVIEFIHDDVSRPHLGMKISSYLGSLVCEIENGVAVYNPEYGSFCRES